MSRLFYHTMQDNLGNLLFGVSGTMRLAGTGTLATIYGDEALTIILPNPMTNHPSFGSFKCFLGVGDYDFYMAKPGYTFETLTGLQGLGSMAEQDASNVTVTQLTVNGASTFQDPALFNDTASFATHVVVNAGSFTVFPLSTLTAVDVNGLATFNGSIIANDPASFTDTVSFAAHVAINGGSFTVFPLSTLTALVVNGLATFNGSIVGNDPATFHDTATFDTHVAINGGSFVVFPKSTLSALDVTGLALFTSPTTHTYQKATTHALTVRPTDNDTGPGNALLFVNMGSTTVGAISTTATTTTYATTSDARLKESVEDLEGGLATIEALRPVQFRWKHDGSVGHGFLAQEVQAVVPGAVTGEVGAVDAAGQIVPQGMDAAKLVPYLVDAIKTLQARIAVLEGALGV